MPTTSERASASCVSMSLACRSSARPDSVQLDAAAAAMVEPGAELELQALHALGKPRLGDVHGFSRMAQIEPLGHGKEKLKLAVVHDYVLSVMISHTLRQLRLWFNGVTNSVLRRRRSRQANAPPHWPCASPSRTDDAEESAFHHVGRAQQARARLLRPPDDPHAQSRPAGEPRRALHRRLLQLADLRALPRQLPDRPLRARHPLLGQRHRL